MAKKNTIRYTAADILRYHSGEMSNSEMHSLEKAALEDPFLADAIEGYIKTKTAEKDIEEINRRLSKKEQKKVFSIKQFDHPWTRIAALLIVILGIGYYTFQANRKPDSIVTARNIDTTTSKKDEVVILPKSDSILPDEVITSRETRHYKTYNNKEIETHAKRDGKRKAINDLAKNDIASSAPQPDKLNEGKLDFRDSGITAMRMKVAQTEKYGTNKIIKDSSQRRQVATGLIKDTTPYIIDLNDDESKAFKNYISRNKKIINRDDSGTYKGAVILSFKVDKRGHPEKIRIEQSLCPKCDQQAIMLLKTGPTWEYSNGKRKRVTIDL